MVSMFRWFIDWFKRNELKRIAELQEQLYNANLQSDELKRKLEANMSEEQLRHMRENERLLKREEELLSTIDELYTDIASKDLEVLKAQEVKDNMDNFRVLMDKMGRNATERVAQLRKQLFAQDKRHKKEIENIKHVYDLQIQDLFSQLERQEELADVGMTQDIAKLFFELEDSEAYKQAISDCIKYQGDLVVKGEAGKCFTQWTVEGSRAKGERQTKDNIKLALKLFNLETNETIYKINGRSNLDAVYAKIERSFNAINRMNKVQDIHLQEIYLESKKRLAKLVYEQTMKVKQEKEIEAQRKAQLREQEALEKEINKEKEKLMKEQQQYLKEIARLAKQKNQTDELLARIAELEPGARRRLHHQACSGC